MFSHVWTAAAAAAALCFDTPAFLAGPLARRREEPGTEQEPARAGAGARSQAGGRWRLAFSWVSHGHPDTAGLWTLEGEEGGGGLDM